MYTGRIPRSSKYTTAKRFAIMVRSVLVNSRPKSSSADFVSFACVTLLVSKVKICCNMASLTFLGETWGMIYVPSDVHNGHSGACPGTALYTLNRIQRTVKCQCNMCILHKATTT